MDRELLQIFLLVIGFQALFIGSNAVPTLLDSSDVDDIPDKRYVDLAFGKRPAGFGDLAFGKRPSGFGDLAFGKRRMSAFNSLAYGKRPYDLSFGKRGSDSSEEMPFFYRKNDMGLALEKKADDAGDSQGGGPLVPPPPPLPPVGQVQAGRIQQSSSESTQPQTTANGTPVTVEIGGERVPKALAAAFKDPRKDKKPFSYFPGGLAPDLSDAHPSSVRKTNTSSTVQVARPRTPKVLPIISDETATEPHYPAAFSSNGYTEDDHLNAANQSNAMPLVHTQYNDPISLYSKSNVNEALNQATGGTYGSSGATLNPLNVATSGTYRALQREGQPLPAHHSARLEETRGEEYPHYKGFVDPNLQSPSFRRLQYATGSAPDAEDEMQIRAPAIAKPYGQTEPKHAPAPSQVYNPATQQTFGASTWSEAGPPVSQRDPTVLFEGGERDHDLDPNFAAKIAAAERPNVPPSAAPSWTRQATSKQQKWQSYADHVEPDRQQREYAAPTPAWVPMSSDRQDKWQQHYSQHHFRSDQASARSASRARSQEPSETFGRREFFKPYVAPNVGSGSVSSRSAGFNMPLTASKSTSNIHAPMEFAAYYGPRTKRGTSAHSMSSTSMTTSRQNNQWQSSSRSAPSVAPKQVTISTLVSGEAERPGAPAASAPYWAQTAEQKHAQWESNGTNSEQQRGTAYGDRPPSWVSRAEQTTSKWQHEAEAQRQQQSMEQDVNRRAYQQNVATTTLSGSGAGPQLYGGGTGSSPSWRQKPVPHEADGRGGSTSVVSYTTSGPGPVLPQWRSATGASTKSSASGAYLDPEGHKVSYTKEVYTSSDPGKEFSMLTEEEKKVMEEPLQPGVVSRHVTTKYYKKSSYTSTTTTGTTQTPPAQSSSYQAGLPSAKNLYIEDAKPGPLSAGISQF